jgi:hypothetical protein
MEKQYTFDQDIVSDIYKDAYNMRPGDSFWHQWENATDDGKQVIWDNLLEWARLSALQERHMQIDAEARLEKEIATMCSKYRIRREDAIRHLHAKHDTNGDVEYLEYHLGVRYGYLSGSLKVGY